jgi:hypothetical protein
MSEQDVEWNRIRDTPHNPEAQIVILNPDAHLNAPARPGVKGERRKAFLLYHAFPCVKDYIEAVGVLTDAGLIRRYPGQARKVANSDINWDIWKGHIRVNEPARE